jgi:hypothetical protein
MYYLEPRDIIVLDGQKTKFKSNILKLSTVSNDLLKDIIEPFAPGEHTYTFICSSIIGSTDTKRIHG